MRGTVLIGMHRVDMSKVLVDSAYLSPEDYDFNTPRYLRNSRIGGLEKKAPTFLKTIYVPNHSSVGGHTALTWCEEDAQYEMADEHPVYRHEEHFCEE